MPVLAKTIKRAIVSGPIPRLRNWRRWMHIEVDPETNEEHIWLDPDRKPTKAEEVMLFAECFLRAPEGIEAGKRLRLAPFQEAFLYAIFDNPEGTNYAILSMARRNGKSFLVALILLAFIFGPLSKPNEVLASAANSRDQAALVFRLMSLMVVASPELSEIARIIPSQKRIISLANGSEYYAMSADAKTGYGRGLAVVVLDEAGQIIGPVSEFVSMLTTSQGSIANPMFITISTQAPSDGDWLSRAIDDAERSNDPHTVAHVYRGAENGELSDRASWAQANPGLGVFRSKADLKRQIEKAIRMPSEEAATRNLLLNERISLEQLAIAPATWKQCSAAPDMEVFRSSGEVAIGLDLSSRGDLTAAVLAAADEDGICSVLPFVFCPSTGIEARSRRDRAPYDQWVRDGFMIPVGGASMDFDQIAASLRDELDVLRVSPTHVYFDRHMIEHFKAACERQGALTDAEWMDVPQHFKDMGVRLASLQGMLANNEINHGSHPLLNMAAANAIAKLGREGISALEKNKSTMRIDPLVAMVMAVWPFGDGKPNEFEWDVNAMIA